MASPSANTPRKPPLRTKCATAKTSVLYNDSFRWLVTPVRRINWSCYSVAARRDPSCARSRVQPSTLRARGLRKRTEENGFSFTARSRRRRKYRLALCNFEMRLQSAFFRSADSVGHEGEKSLLWVDEFVESMAFGEERKLTLLRGIFVLNDIAFVKYNQESCSLILNINSLTH